MNELEERSISCPYCGENIDVLLEASIEEQRYIEDCQVCCRPISFLLSVNYDGDIQLIISHEDSA